MKIQIKPEDWAQIKNSDLPIRWVNGNDLSLLYRPNKGYILCDSILLLVLYKKEDKFIPIEIEEVEDEDTN